MKKSIHFGLFSVLCLASLLLGACDPAPSQTAQPDSTSPTVPSEAPVILPTAAAPGIAGLIDSYLAEQIGSAYMGGRVFCAYELMDWVHDEHQQQTTLYLWVLCQEYLAVGDTLEKGTGVSVPVALYVSQTGDGWQMAHRLPGDGTQYGQDVRILFPQHLWGEILAENPQAIERYNQRAETLERLSEQAARIFYLFEE